MSAVQRSHQDRVLKAVRLACLGLPQVSERLSHGCPSFFIRGKQCFVMFIDDHHGDDRSRIWCAAPPGVQAELVESEPERFFVPPYVGHRGWLGLLLIDVDQEELAAICREAFRTVAPKRVLAELDGAG